MMLGEVHQQIATENTLSVRCHVGGPTWCCLYHDGKLLSSLSIRIIYFRLFYPKPYLCGISYLGGDNLGATRIIALARATWSMPVHCCSLSLATNILCLLLSLCLSLSKCLPRSLILSSHCHECAVVMFIWLWLHRPSHPVPSCVCLCQSCWSYLDYLEDLFLLRCSIWLCVMSTHPFLSRCAHLHPSQMCVPHPYSNQRVYLRLMIVFQYNHHSTTKAGVSLFFSIDVSLHTIFFLDYTHTSHLFYSNLIVLLCVFDIFSWDV